MSRFLLAAFLATLTGCSSYRGTAQTFEGDDLAAQGWIAVRDVRLVAQEESNDCGSAALAMVLGYWGHEADARSISEACHLEPGTGISAGALREVARAHGLRAYVLASFLPDLVRELSRGRPVVVGLVKPVAAGALAHFEVVVGIHPEKLLVATLDPGHGYRSNSFDGFLAEWRSAGFVTLVVFPPAQKPAAPVPALALGEKQ
ncbi:MAG: cysteine peptidase family C39 domain-containing protein [Planctomycetota bacterium]